MYMNGLYIKQADGLYYLFTEFGELKGILYLPQDLQYMADFNTLNHITKVLAIRWRIINPPKKTR